VQVLNSSAIASGYAGRDPQGGFCDRSVYVLYWNRYENKRRFYSVFKLRKLKRIMLELKRKWKMKKVEKSKDDKKITMYKWSEWRTKNWKKWWFNLQMWKKGKKMKRYLPRLSDDLPGNRWKFYLCFGGVQCIDHKLELSPHSHYIIKSWTSMKWYVLRRRKSSWTIVGSHVAELYLLWSSLVKLNKHHQGKVEEKEESKTKY